MISNPKEPIPKKKAIKHKTNVAPIMPASLTMKLVLNNKENLTDSLISKCTQNLLEMLKADQNDMTDSGSSEFVITFRIKKSNQT